MDQSDDSNAAQAAANDAFEVDVPIFIELKNSSFSSNDLGAYCTMPLNADQFMGSYKGKVRKSMAQCADPEYVWTILSSRQMPLFYIDATDARDSNWLRFIRSTSDASKYNVICMQQNQQINYFTFRDIKVGEELVTYLAGKKKKRAKNHQTKTYKLYEPLSILNTNPAAQANQNGPKTGSLSRANSNGSGILTRSTRFYRRNEDFPPKNQESKRGGKARGKGDEENKFKIETKRLLVNIISDQTDHFKMNSFSLKPFAAVDSSNGGGNGSGGGGGSCNEPNSSRYCLLKCDLCSFSCVALEASLDALTKLNAQLKRHILVEHVNQDLFSGESGRDETELTCLQVLNSLLNRIESDSGVGGGDSKLLGSGFRFYQCNKCSAKEDQKPLRFSRKNDLVRHLISKHSVNANTLKCPKCDKSFDKTRAYDCLKHLATKHEDEWLKDTIPVSITSHHDFVESNRMNWTDYFNEAVSASVFSLESIVNGGNEEAGGGDELDDASSQSSSTASSSGTTSSSSHKKRGGNKTGSNGKKQRKNGDEDAENEDGENNEDGDEDEEDDENGGGGGKKSGGKGDSNGDATASQSTKTWTCQLCKKQFDQRVDLNKHQCIELHLKQLKKKKEIRKKKWREAHWKRKIDLSYIETTSLTQFSQIIADNLSFCIDGTNEDLKAYAREVKDYLNTELGDETQMQMLMKYFFPELNDRVMPAPPAAPSAGNHHQSKGNHHHGHHHGQVNSKFVDTNAVRRANAYFVDCVHTATNDVHSLPPALTGQKATGRGGSGANGAQNNLVNLTSLSMFQCKTCRLKCKKLSELITHQRETHGMKIKTTFDCYNKPAGGVVESSEKNGTEETGESNENVEAGGASKTSESLNWLSSNTNAISPVGYLGCDPFAYVLNLHWDQNIQKRCEHCNGVFTRQKHRKHVLSCPANSQKTEPPASVPELASESAAVSKAETTTATATENGVELSDTLDEADEMETSQTAEAPDAAELSRAAEELERSRLEREREAAIREACSSIMDGLIDAVVTMKEEQKTAEPAETAAVEEASEPKEAAEADVSSQMESLAAETGQSEATEEKSASGGTVKSSVSSPESEAASKAPVTRTRRKRSAMDDLQPPENLILNKKRQVAPSRNSYDSENYVYFHQTKSSPPAANQPASSKTASPPAAASAKPAVPAQGRSLRGSANKAASATPPATVQPASLPTRHSPRAAKPAAVPAPEPPQVHSSSPLSSKTTRSVQARQLVLTPKSTAATTTAPTPPASQTMPTRSSSKSVAEPEPVKTEPAPAEPKSEGANEAPVKSQNQLRMSARIRRKPQEPSEDKKPVEKFRRCVASPSGSTSERVKAEATPPPPTTPTTAAAVGLDSKKDISPTLAAINNKLVRIELIDGDRKIYVCSKCGLEFTSPNSAIRHQEKSCLRVCVINIKLPNHQHTRMCPICSCVFNNTHRLSVHIYKYHRALLGSAQTGPAPEAKRLHEIQLKKSKTIACDQIIVEENENENDNENDMDHETDGMDDTPFNSTKDVESLNMSTREARDEKSVSEFQNTTVETTDLNATLEDVDESIATDDKMDSVAAEVKAESSGALAAVEAQVEEAEPAKPAASEPSEKVQEEPSTPRLRKRANISASEEKKRPSDDGPSPAAAVVAFRGAVTRKKSNSLSSNSSLSNVNQPAVEEPATPQAAAAMITSRTLRTSSRLSTDSNKNANGKLNSTF